MKFSYNWLQSFFKDRLPKAEKLAELLTMHSFEVEGVGKKGKDYLLDIDILPNRAPDCFSHLGIAREISAILGKKLETPDIVLKEEGDSKDFLKVEVKDSKDCPRYNARIVKNVKVDSSPKWIKEKLEACGIQSINNIVDIANYVMLETGQPLHAFDYDKISGAEIIVRRAKKGEEIVSLDNNKYKLDSNTLVIADKESPLAIAGIKGGKKAEITNKTKTIVLESANFDYLLIRHSSKILDLKTDASWRFENQIDPNLTREAIDKATFLIQKGIVLKPIDVYPKKRTSLKIKLDPEYVRSLLGVDIKDKKIEDIFKRLDFEVLKKGKVFEVKAPTRRLDVLIPEDLVEEVGRIYGFEDIDSKFPLVFLVPPERNLSVFWENIIKDVLKEAGFTEVYNYSFIGEKEAEIFNYREKELLKLKNPLSSDYIYLRPSLIPGLLKNARDNSKNFKDINIFELSKVFSKKKEERVLSLLSNDYDFYSLKGMVDLLLNKLGISEIWYDDFEPTPQESKKSFWEKGRCAEIKVDFQEIGFIGEISSDILKKMKISQRVVLFDINFEELQKLASEEQEYRPISRYPSAIRDIAVLVPREVKVEEVMNVIELAGGDLIRDIDLFDIYEDERLPEGKKNLAFHIIYQAENKTLSNKEINNLQEKVIKALETEAEWQVRK